MTELWKHQQDAIAESLLHRDYALFWEMGTGKTCGTINMLRRKYQQYEKPLKTLILAPPVVLHNWMDEFRKHSPDTNPALIEVLEGTGKKRREKMETIRRNLITRTIVITNYETMLMEDVWDELYKWQPEIVVCDECHYIKNPKAKRAKKVEILCDRAKHRYILTGTPILNNSMDIFQQFRCLDQGQTFGQNFFAFRGRFFEDRNAGMPKHRYFPDWQPKTDTYQELNDLILAKSSRVTKEECMDLPELVKEKVHVELSPEQKRHYKQMKDSFVAFMNTDHGDEPKAMVAQQAITKALRLQQIVSGYFKDDEGSEHSYAKNPRLAALKELLEQLTPDHKVIVWASFKANYTDIARVCDELGIKHAELTGNTKDKQKEIDKFRKKKDVRVMIANQSAGGVGINLVEASYAIYYSRSFNLGHDLQSEARNHRGGSEIHNRVTRLDLVADGTIDEQVMEALECKQDIAKAILDWKDRV
jgi:SNF2 family DNA or RNA helicase